MKKIIKLSLLLTALLIFTLTLNVQAQTTPADQSTYKDWIAENPNADADIKIVRDYLNAIAEGDLDKVANLLADEYKGYGPSPVDSTTKELTITRWKENYTTQKNRKIGFVNVTYRVLKGFHKGDHVTVWGTYSFSINDKNIDLPFQFTAKVSNGKLVSSMIYFDNWHIYKTLGYTLTPPPEEIK